LERDGSQARKCEAPCVLDDSYYFLINLVTKVSYQNDGQKSTKNINT